ncbi:MAG: hypothetical protein ETSY1_36635, partial [Candidatus Entotheonella factor]
MIALDTHTEAQLKSQRWPHVNGYVIILIIVLYSVSIGSQLSQPIVGDEIRYLDYARNLLNGAYALAKDGGIRNGPGYPLLLAPLVAMGIPDAWLRLANLPLVCLGLLYVYATIAIYTSRRVASITTVLLALYPPLVFLSGQLMTEAFGLFLFAGFAYHFLTWQQSARGGIAHLLLTSLYLGALALTKVIFGYVIIALLMLIAGFRLIPGLYRRLIPRGTAEMVFILAFLCCTPYLVYTYAVTSKIFYWSTNGGENLYWMTVTGAKIWGSWVGPQTSSEMTELSPEQRDFLAYVSTLNAVERDTAYKQKFVEQVMKEPHIYLWNWISNVTRMLFNYPYSKRQQSLFTYGYLAPNMLGCNSH